MTDGVVAEHYFEWLYRMTGLPAESFPAYSYKNVCWRMHRVPFAGLVPHDENRMADASELRKLFQQAAYLHEPLDEIDLFYPDVTMLEVMIGLAKRAAFMVEHDISWWMEHFIRNLGLARFNDQYCLDRSTRWIDKVLEKFNNREYKPDGQGGLFPLKIPNQDQRQVELWYQMGAYMTENLMY